ncbi:hypothetical protein GX48_01050 [Paracoccidioides brasiliensis]|nr:hypothetical protein GX48_01050 [Paracoccidioides brasiliensis]
MAVSSKGKISGDMGMSKRNLLAEWSFFAVCSVLMILRLGLRLRFYRRLFWEDTFAAFGYLFLFAMDVVAMYCVHHIEVYENLAIETPRWNHHFNAMLKLSFTVDVLYNFVIYSIKASFLSFMWRIFHSIPGFRKPWWIITISTVILGLGSLLLEPGTCVKFYLGPCAEKDDIRRNNITLKTGAALDILTDFMIMALPIAFIANSKLPWNQKLGIICLFSLGFVIVATSLVRIISLNFPGMHPPVSWKLFWAMIESSIAVITSCFASCRSLYTLLKRSDNSRSGLSVSSRRIWPSRRRAHPSPHPFDISMSVFQSRSSPSKVATENGEVQPGPWADGESAVKILSQSESETPDDRPTT